MPSNTPTVEEEAAPEESSHDVLPLPVQVIERNRLTEMEIRALPRFKDYTHGTPSKVGGWTECVCMCGVIGVLVLPP